LSLPRQRAILAALDRFFPAWPTLIVHESSPSGPASSAIERRCGQYSTSFLLEGVAEGTERDGRICQNLERLTFPPESFDLFISQDVMEHVMDPAAAFAEIGRVLKPGGAHVFTVPYWPDQPTKVRARAGPGAIDYLEQPRYHDSPVGIHGALVVTDWGQGLPDVIFEASGLGTSVHDEDNPDLGLRGGFKEVFVTLKP
jgi:SAM-dependent methyltransferase